MPFAGKQVTQAAPEGIGAKLETVRKAQRLPALAAAVIEGGRVTQTAVVGVRRWGTDDSAAPADPFHVGSCGKAMTATLVGILADAGKLSLDATLVDLLPDLKADMHPDYRDVTLLRLLQHRSGLPEETFPGGVSPFRWFADKRPLPAQRAAYARLALKQKPAARPGEKMIYSNAGYAVAGHVAERVGGGSAPFEELLRRRVFAPLGITSAGFGPQPKTAPWPHRITGDGAPEPVAPGPLTDNAPLLSPIGRVHLTIADWAKFAALHLGSGPTLLKPATLARLHAPFAKPKGPGQDDYAAGWIVARRDWAGGDGLALTHAGSNTLNYTLAWLAPASRFGVLVATNAMGDRIPAAADAALTELLLPLIRKAG